MNLRAPIVVGAALVVTVGSFLAGQAGGGTVPPARSDAAAPVAFDASTGGPKVRPLSASRSLPGLAKAHHKTGGGGGGGGGGTDPIPTATTQPHITPVPTTTRPPVVTPAKTPEPTPSTFH